MLRPEIVEPATVGDAVSALRQHRGAMALAGATDLIPAIRRGLAKPRLLVNLKRIPALAGVRRARGGVSIGALTTVAEVLASPILAENWPVLVETAREFGSAQIRNMATIGGNLCNATPSADFPLPLLALDARLRIAGPKGERELPLSEFFVGANKTALSAGEIVTAILVPRVPAHTGAAFVRLGVRKAMDLPIAAAAAAITVAPDGRKCRKARIALGAVAPTPMRATGAESLLEGSAISGNLIGEAAAAAARESKPLTDLRASAEYRRDMIVVLVGRALEQAFARAGGAS